VGFPVAVAVVVEAVLAASAAEASAVAAPVEAGRKCRLHYKHKRHKLYFNLCLLCLFLLVNWPGLWGDFPSFKNEFITKPMKTSQHLIINTCILSILLILPSFYSGPLKNSNEQEFFAKANLFNLKFPQEKIYLHLDRPSYWANDDIWFKAYLKNSPISESNLYVELVNSSGEVVSKNICWVQNGLAYGDIHVDEELSSGVYQIRAYTNWLRNFDDTWFFRKNLVVWNLRDKQPAENSKELTTKDVDLQFFPEGGTFISGVKNRVAFKAIDKNGKGVDFQGEITDDLGNKIASLKSGFKGIGSVVFEPQEGRKYKAQVTVPGGKTLDIDLPKSESTGEILSVDPTSSKNIQITVSFKGVGSEPVSGKEYLVIGQSGGAVCFQKKIVASPESGTFEINKSFLPAGIVKFTLFDQAMIPHCERLVFVNHQDHINIEIKTDKTDYLNREKVELELKSISTEGIPCIANLSVSVYNAENQFQTEKYPDNILTHFLLSSELRGTIEEPAYYFKDDSLSTLLALDNVMLTHGYRQFEWKEIREDKYPEIAYQPVGCIQLGGTVTSTVRGRPVPKAKVTMMTVKSLLATYEQTADSLGRFLFTDLYFNDTLYVALQAVNQKGNRNTEIEIDVKSATSPKSTYLPFNYKFEKENEAMTSTFLSELSPEIINRKWRLSDTIMLGDINVMTRKMKKSDRHNRPYAEADYVFEVSKFDMVNNDIFEMMDLNSAAMRSFMGKGPQLFLDGAPVDMEFIADKPVSWFDKVEAVTMAPGPHGIGPGLFFYTKRGAPHYVPADVFGMKSYAVLGYSVIRQFYSPEYENREIPVERKDFRSTIYWNPIVITDSTGVAHTSFYNSDEVGNMQIIVEGVTADGKLCRGVGSYKVGY
jgi:hypothetical protein